MPQEQFSPLFFPIGKIFSFYVNLRPICTNFADGLCCTHARKLRFLIISEKDKSEEFGDREAGHLSEVARRQISSRRRRRLSVNTSDFCIVFTNKSHFLSPWVT